ncbi:hypothetical protein CPB85DRAFT_1357638 [Mucidula mucida]|nr:hypothetical protein CPB85DRAFT_1357638 [Mucidula mucida]
MTWIGCMRYLPEQVPSLSLYTFRLLSKRVQCSAVCTSARASQYQSFSIPKTSLLTKIATVCCTVLFRGCLPSVHEVAWGMGEMLARLHYRASVDARDVEFVLGGDGGAGTSTRYAACSL